MKATELNQALHDHFSEEELANCFSIRGYKLTPKGEQALKDQRKKHLQIITIIDKCL